MTNTKAGFFGRKAAVAVVTDNDPLDPVATDDIYNRYQETDMEGYPEVPLHLGDPNPHATATGVDTFYGFDNRSPTESEHDDGTLANAPSGVEAVTKGLEDMRRGGEARVDSHRVKVNTNASGDWKAGTFWIDNTKAYRIVDQHDNRGDVVVVNWSTADIYLSHHSMPDVTSSATPDVVKVIANGGARTIRTEKEIYARGTGVVMQQIDVQEEYN